MSAPNFLKLLTFIGTEIYWENWSFFFLWMLLQICEITDTRNNPRHVSAIINTSFYL